VTAAPGSAPRAHVDVDIPGIGRRAHSVCGDPAQADTPGGCESALARSGRCLVVPPGRDQIGGCCCTDSYCA